MEDIFSPDPFLLESGGFIFQFDESIPVTKETAEAWRGNNCNSTCKECPMYGMRWFRTDKQDFLLYEFKNCAFSFGTDKEMMEAFLKRYHQ